MAPWTWVLIVVIVVVLIVVAVMLANRSRTSSLQKRFGPEYERTVESADGRRAAEAELQDRTKRRSALEIRPLPEPTRLRYAEEWRGLQEQFVDRPSDAVSSAERLLTRVMEDRGYPVADVDDQAEMVSVDHPDVVENYRIAHGIYERNQANQATTEDLREAFLRYRSLFDGLLRPEDSRDVRRDARDGQPNGTTNTRAEQR
jgi:hypothetical protein